MTSGPHAHTITALSTRIDDPLLSPQRVYLDEESLSYSRQRTIRRPVLTATRIGGGGATVVITFGDATRHRIDLDSPVPPRS